VAATQAAISRLQPLWQACVAVMRAAHQILVRPCAAKRGAGARVARPSVAGRTRSARIFCGHDHVWPSVQA
jgi:hypothetical protein